MRTLYSISIFAESNITNDIHNNSLLMELRDTENETLVGVLGFKEIVWCIVYIKIKMLL